MVSLIFIQILKMCDYYLCNYHIIQWYLWKDSMTLAHDCSKSAHLHDTRIRGSFLCLSNEDQNFSMHVNMLVRLKRSFLKPCAHGLGNWALLHVCAQLDPNGPRVHAPKFCLYVKTVKNKCVLICWNPKEAALIHWFFSVCQMAKWVTNCHRFQDHSTKILILLP